MEKHFHFHHEIRKTWASKIMMTCRPQLWGSHKAVLKKQEDSSASELEKNLWRDKTGGLVRSGWVKVVNTILALASI